MPATCCSTAGKQATAARPRRLWILVLVLVVVFFRTLVSVVIGIQLIAVVIHVVLVCVVVRIQTVATVVICCSAHDYCSVLSRFCRIVDGDVSAGLETHPPLKRYGQVSPSTGVVRCCFVKKLLSEYHAGRRLCDNETSGFPQRRANTGLDVGSERLALGRLSTATYVTNQALKRIAKGKPT